MILAWTVGPAAVLVAGTLRVTRGEHLDFWAIALVVVAGSATAGLHRAPVGALARPIPDDD